VEEWETPIEQVPSERGYLNQYPTPSPGEGSGFSFRNFVFFNVFLEYQTMDNV
jgi:hypothetical protein